MDASIIFPLLVNEEKSEVACEIYTRHQDIIYLDFLSIEIANALASLVRRRRFDQAFAIEAMEKLNLIISESTSTHHLLPTALKLALEINYPIYDCLYAIGALTNNATLITCDAKFAAKLDPAVYRVQVV